MAKSALIKRGRESRVLHRRTGMRAKEWKWFKEWDGNPDDLLARYDTLNATERLLCVQRMSAPYREEVLRCILNASYQVMPARHPNERGPHKYSPRQLWAMVAYRWWLGLGHAAALKHLRENDPERYLIFGRIYEMPVFFFFFRYEKEHSQEVWPRFLSALADVNPGAAQVIYRNLSSIND